MDITIVNTSEKPIYQQIFEQISSQILRGDLESDYSLPPIRTAAKELRVSIITVKKAWEQLEREGYIYTVTGRGCFVCDLSPKNKKQIRDEIVDGKMAEDIKYYKELGLTKEEVIDFVQKHY